MSRRSAPARGRDSGATAAEGSGAPEACVPRPEPPQAGSAAAPPSVRLPHQAGCLALWRSPAGPHCHQAQGCRPGALHSPAARTARALPLNGCPGAGPTRPVLGGTRPPAKVTGGRRPSRSREYPSLERHCEGHNLGLKVGKLRPEDRGNSPRSAETLDDKLRVLCHYYFLQSVS